MATAHLVTENQKGREIQHHTAGPSYQCQSQGAKLDRQSAFDSDWIIEKAMYLISLPGTTFSKITAKGAGEVAQWVKWPLYKPEGEEGVQILGTRVKRLGMVHTPLIPALGDGDG